MLDHFGLFSTIPNPDMSRFQIPIVHVVLRVIYVNNSAPLILVKFYFGSE